MTTILDFFFNIPFCKLYFIFRISYVFMQIQKLYKNGCIFTRWSTAWVLFARKWHSNGGPLSNWTKDNSRHIWDMNLIVVSLNSYCISEWYHYTLASIFYHNTAENDEVHKILKCIQALNSVDEGMITKW